MAWYHPGSAYQALSEAFAPKPVPQAPVTQPRQSLLPNFLQAVSVNPHGGLFNSVITHADAHPSTSRVWAGMGRAVGTPFAPGNSAGVWGGSLNSLNVIGPAGTGNTHQALSGGQPDTAMGHVP